MEALVDTENFFGGWIRDVEDKRASKKKQEQEALESMMKDEERRRAEKESEEKKLLEKKQQRLKEKLERQVRARSSAKGDTFFT